MSNYIPVIGLEIHVELKTKTKMFCQCLANQWEVKPNSHVCPVCLGLPGALPVPNKKAIEWTIKIAKALNCHINQTTKFDRKHYSYPDLPKGYQISQYDEPIGINGYINLADSVIHENSSRCEVRYSTVSDEALRNPPAGGPQSASRGTPSHFITSAKFNKYRIHRVHLEEDTGKLIHRGEDTLVDFNRSGTPLVEIVTEPDFDSAEDVRRFLEELHTIIRYLDVSDADMEKGTMRMEPNISLRIQNLEFRFQNEKFKLPNYKVEVKNINSFRFVKQAIEYEIERQTEILESGKTPEQETRGFDEKKVVTYSQRSKEEAHDYRYFPEPDIPPLTFSKEYIDSIEIPELPAEKLERYITKLGLKEKDAFIITRDIKLSRFFEEVNLKFRIQNSELQLKIPSFAKASEGKQNLEQTLANIIINKKISTDLPVEEFVKRLLELLTPKETDIKMLEVSVIRIIENNKKVVDEYKAGKQNAIMFLVGQVMRELKGKVEAKIVIEELKKKLT